MIEGELRDDVRIEMWDAPFVQKHASFVPQFLPLGAVMVIETHVAKLIKDGDNGGISPTQHFEIMLIS